VVGQEHYDAIIAFRTESAPHLLIIRERVNAELVSISGHLQQVIKRFQVGQSFGPARLHAPAPREAQVVARLGLHGRQQIGFALFQVQRYRASRLQAAGWLKAKSDHCPVYFSFGRLLVESNTRLYFEEDSSAPARQLVHALPEGTRYVAVSRRPG
jgi:hypothetical protein